MWVEVEFLLSLVEGLSSLFNLAEDERLRKFDED